MQISIQNLSKIYGQQKRALDDVSLQIESGLFGLLGPNGAGKTTLMRILVTLMEPTSGQVLVDGRDLQHYRKEIRAISGYLPQGFSAFSKIRTWEFLDYCARLSGLKAKAARRDAVDAMLEKVGLFEARDRMAKKLSGGMKRRLGIAQALIGDPKLLIVDEPTTGLDPEERIRFRNILADMGHSERIIILSTHIVGDISSTCNDMALLNQGRVGFHGPPEQFIRQAAGHAFQLEVSDRDLPRIKEKYAVISTIPAERGWLVQVVANRLEEPAGKTIEPDLEHAYVYFMDKQAG
ncbi:MAG: ABC transporter ATP-binding protein [Calditrichaeota bacterium]|nr:ABC transporter ATP-binding protein [Calditrichota bacterium]MCB0307077.1 ABC transporter ATP-binding protein [Calditrichota bacterium]MCB9089827.1 ABC transporter ATP-binding protein [Calditrichia bacterium]